jgi:small-conductance mechanosensitive channel
LSPISPPDILGFSDTGTTTNSDEPPASQKANKNNHRVFSLNVINTAVRSALATFITDPDVLRIVSKILSTIAWSYIALSALGTFGVDTKPLLSLLGVGGLTFGFSIKDLLADCFAGLFVLFVRPFQRGDLVTVGGLKGRVVSLDMRYVKLYSEEERAEILVPVAAVYRSEIKIHRK